MESAKPGATRKPCARLLRRRQGRLQKPDLVSGFGTLKHLIRGERELARTDCTWAPPSVNYTGPCCHPNLQGNLKDHEEEAAGNTSLQTPLVEHHVCSLNNSAERTNGHPGKCGNAHQTRGGEPLGQGWQLGQGWHECSDQGLNHHLLRAEWQSLLACCLVLSASGDNDLKYKPALQWF